MEKNLSISLVGTLLVVVHTKQNPSEMEAQSTFPIFQESIKKYPTLRAIVFTEGGAPSPAQRNALREVMRGHDLPVAVLSAALIARFVNASISLFHRSLRSYAPNEYPQACEYLRIYGQEKFQLEAALQAVQREFGEERTPSITRALHTRYT